MSNKELTLKVTILLAFTTSSGISALHILDLNNTLKTVEYYEYRFHKLHKSRIRGQSPLFLKIYAFSSEKALCEVAALDCYIERTSIWREKIQAFQSLVSFIKPHNVVPKSTVAACWVKQMLIMSGINTDIFKTHFTRSLSSSHARLSGLSSPDIIKRGSWSNKTTLERLSWLLKKNFRKLLRISKALPPRWKPPWRGEGAYLTKRFQPAYRQEELVGVMLLVWAEQTDLLKYLAKECIQYCSL